MEANNKLRKALEKCANWGEQIDCQLGSSDATVYAFREERSLAHNISECARAALAEPVRNCEVGTAEEQRVRFEAWCEKQPERYCKACAECPTQRYAINCFCKWAQMPYEEQEGGAE